jgi:hypothetical protein
VAVSKQDRVEKNDEQIGDAIEARIDALNSLDDSDIDIEVSNGVARLTGTVDSRSDQVAALTVARSTAGVVRVIDDLRLNPPAVSGRGRRSDAVMPSPGPGSASFPGRFTGRNEWVGSLGSAA